MAVERGAGEIVGKVGKRADKQRRHQARRERYEFARRRDFRRGRAHKRHLRALRRGRRPSTQPYRRETIVVAPRDCRLVENASEVIGFVDRIRQAKRRSRSPYLDLARVDSLSPDTVQLLHSTMKDPRLPSAPSHGNVPMETSAARLLMSSGFFDDVEVPPAGLKDVTPSGRMKQRTSTKVEPETANELVRLAETTLGKLVCRQASYRTLSEAMNNTRHHASSPLGRSSEASGPKKHEAWWASVYCDRKRGIATFTMIDNGIGVVESIKRRRLIHLFHALGLRSEAEIVEGLFRRGVIGSRTKQSNRNQGLPFMLQDLEEGRIRNLVFITNGVMLEVGTWRSTPLERAFSGTIVRWEAEAASRSRN